MHCSMRTVVSCTVRDCVCHKLPFCNMAEEISSSSDDDNHMSDDSQQTASRKRRLDIPPNQVHDEKRRKHDRPSKFVNKVSYFC
jgi:hypothetical protein